MELIRFEPKIKVFFAIGSLNARNMGGGGIS
jgi:hypothetical protein